MDVAPLIVSPPSVAWVNPEKIAPVFSCRIPLAFVNVPLPVIEPLNKIFPAPKRLGFTPKGRAQLLLIVFAPALLKVIRLNVTLLQLKVLFPLPLNVTVPLPWLKVELPEIVNPAATVKVPLDALKVPLT